MIFEIHGNTGEGLFVSARAGDVNHDGRDDVLVASTSAETIRLFSGRTHAVILEIVDDVSGTNFGSSLGSAGDFDGDGTLDIITGVPNDSPNGTFWSGSTRVYSGRDGHEIARWNGTIYSGRMGLAWSVGLGDIDGDGYPDVATAGLFDRVWILGGPDMHLLRYHDGVLTRPSVAGTGDIDGDGRPDYICGWPQDSTMGTWTGRATVFSGIDGSEVFTVYGQTPQTGSQTGDHLGLSVAGVGDVNGDGVPDFAAGAPGEIEPNGMFTPSHGMVRVYSGADASILWEWQAEDHTLGASSFFGFRVLGGDDINGDGYPDLVVSAPFDRPEVFTASGSVCVFSGRTGEQLWRVLDPANSVSLSAWFTSLLGDIDGDGLADFTQGNRGYSDPTPFVGRVRIFAGAAGDAEHFCPAAMNSGGTVAQLAMHGPIGIENNHLSLAVTHAVPSQTGLFFYGAESPPLPFGDGIRCIGRPFFRVPGAVQLDGSGSAEQAIDLQSRPFQAGPGAVFPGSTWVFQFWYADPGAAAGFDLSDAMRIRFLP